MAKKVPVPDELRSLLPENNVKVVLVGSTAYEMLPLPEGMLEKVSSIVSDFLTRVSPKLQDNGGISPGESVDSVLTAFFSSKGAPALVAMILDIDLEEARKMSIPELGHFAGCFYQQNFSDEGIPAESRKNLDTLLGRFGMRAPRAAKTEECLDRIARLVNMSKGAVLSETITRVMLDTLAPEQFSTYFPQSTAGVENTSLAEESEDAPSRDNLATQMFGTKNTSSSAPRVDAKLTKSQIEEYRRRKVSGSAIAATAASPNTSNTESRG